MCLLEIICDFPPRCPVAVAAVFGFVLAHIFVCVPIFGLTVSWCESSLFVCWGRGLCAFVFVFWDMVDRVSSNSKVSTHFLEVKLFCFLSTIQCVSLSKYSSCMCYKLCSLCPFVFLAWRRSSRQRPTWRWGKKPSRHCEGVQEVGQEGRRLLQQEHPLQARTNKNEQEERVSSRNLAVWILVGRCRGVCSGERWRMLVMLFSFSFPRAGRTW